MHTVIGCRARTAGSKRFTLGAVAECRVVVLWDYARNIRIRRRGSKITTVL